MTKQLCKKVKVEIFSLDAILSDNNTEDTTYLQNDKLISYYKLSFNELAGIEESSFDDVDIEMFIYGLTLDESRVLLFLSLGLRQKDMNVLLKVGKSRISRIVRELKAKAKMLQNR